MAFRFETANERWKWFKQADWQDEPASNGSWEETSRELNDVEQAVRVKELVNEMYVSISPILEGATENTIIPINSETAETISMSAVIAAATLEQWPVQPGDWLVTNYGSKPAEEAKQMVLGSLDRLGSLANIASSPDAEYRPEGWGEDEPYYPEWDEEEEEEEDPYGRTRDPVKEASDKRVYDEYRNIINGLIMFISGNAWRNAQVEFTRGDDSNGV